MWVYCVVTIVSVVLAAVAQKAFSVQKGRAKVSGGLWQLNYRIWLVLSAVPFFLCMGLRYNIGTDYWFTYVPMFNQMEQGLHATPDWDLVYWIIFKLCSILFDSPTSVFVVCAAVILGFLWSSIWKVSPAPWFSILIFVVSRQFFICLNGMRQSTALAIVAAALPFIVEKSFPKYAAMVILAGLCHASAFMFLPLYVLCLIPLDPVVAPMLVAVGTLSNGLISRVMRVVVSATKYGKYLGSSFDDGVRYLDYNVFVIAFTFILAVAILSKHPLRREERLLRFLFNIHCLALFVSMNLNVVPLGVRICWSLEYFSIFLIPLLVKRLENRRHKVAVVVTVCVVFGYVMWTRTMQGDHQVYPYATVLLPGVAIR